jgi:uncharacterized protein YkwD
MILAAAAALSMATAACGPSRPSAKPSQPGQPAAWGPPGAPGASPQGEYHEEGQHEQGQHEQGQHEGEYAEGGGEYAEGGGEYAEGGGEYAEYAEGGERPGQGIAEGEPYPAPEAEPAAAPGQGPRRPGNQGGRGNAPRPAEPAGPAEDVPPASKDMASLERGIADEINRLRRNPRAYAASLQRYRGYYDGAFLRLPGSDIPIQTFEGVAAVDEAIAAAKRSKPVPELELSAGLSRAAREHARELGKAGTMDHSGKDGSSPFERMRRHGEMDGMAGENIGTAMHNRAEFSVIDLFVDDGVQGRGHRKNLLTPRYKVVGVGCAPHRAYGTICVMDFAEIYRDR